jgi:phage baseplate assembly protein W
MAVSGLVFYNKDTLMFSESPSDLICENVKRILLTRPGERPNNLEFGSRLRNFLFMPEMLMSDIALEIQSSVNHWEPRAQITGIEVGKIDEETIMIKLSIKNKVTGEISSTSLEF